MLPDGAWRRRKFVGSGEKWFCLPLIIKLFPSVVNPQPRIEFPGRFALIGGMYQRFRTILATGFALVLALSAAQAQLRVVGPPKWVMPPEYRQAQARGHAATAASARATRHLPANFGWRV